MNSQEPGRPGYGMGGIDGPDGAMITRLNIVFLKGLHMWFLH